MASLKLVLSVASCSLAVVSLKLAISLVFSIGHGSMGSGGWCIIVCVLGSKHITLLSVVITCSSCLSSVSTWLTHAGGAYMPPNLHDRLGISGRLWCFSSFTSRYFLWYPCQEHFTLGPSTLLFSVRPSSSLFGLSGSAQFFCSSAELNRNTMFSFNLSFSLSLVFQTKNSVPVKIDWLSKQGVGLIRFLAFMTATKLLNIKKDIIFEEDFQATEIYLHSWARKRESRSLGMFQVRTRILGLVTALQSSRLIFPEYFLPCLVQVFFSQR